MQELRARRTIRPATAQARGLLRGLIPIPRIPTEDTFEEVTVNSREKTELAARLKRIAGQVAGIERMLDGDRDLRDVITQVSAARAALGSVGNILLARHVEESTNHAISIESPRERRELIDQLVRLFEKRDA
jgi:DNA-binding FrmR family transcriptional regulator